MTLKRGDRVPPPPVRGERDIRFHTNAAADGWEELCRQAPGNTSAAFWTMRRDPVPRAETMRHHRLKGRMAMRVVKGRELEHWQIEVTGSGRILYLVDHETHTVWIDYAGPGHPRATDS